MDVVQLSVGEKVSISGVIFTLRENVHRYVQEGNQIPAQLHGSFIYHCGPDVRKKGKKWVVNSAPPDLSAPMDSYTGDIFGRYKVRGIIGRGGMGPKTLAACKRYATCYLTTFGGAGLALARRIKEVRENYLRNQFDGPDAVWELEVEDFPAVVTIDAHGRNLLDIVKDVSSRRFVNLHD